jgi:hypothetical protein
VNQRTPYPVRLSRQEREALERIARAEERTPADVLRRYIRSEAGRRGLWEGVPSAPSPSLPLTSAADDTVEDLDFDPNA